MKYLLDTHTFMWWDADSSNLSESVFEIIADDKNVIFLSAVITWEMTIKVQIGRLSLRANLSEIVVNQVETNGFVLLPIESKHTLKVGELPLHHNDQFDRLLISQAIVDDMTILSKDRVFENYDAKVIC